MQAEPAFTMPDVQQPAIPNAEFHITDFGAVGDGITINTDAFARAIDACADAGGGKVVIPAGLWLTGPIGLKSNINLHAERGAVVMFSRSFEDYPLELTRWEGKRAVRCMSPLHGENIRNFAITGEGIFDGSGDAWRPVKRFKMTDRQWKELVRSGGIVDANADMWWPDEGAMQGALAVAELAGEENAALERYIPYRAYLRPVLLSLRGCSTIRLDGPTFQNSPGWNVHLWDCEHITVRSLTVRNPWYAQNGDGIDLECCRYALIEGCVFDVGDDAICMKSGKNEEGRRLGRPVEYVTVRDCTVYHGHGGFVIGSEMSGGARNMIVSDCEFIGTDIGLRFKSTRGRGGVVENIVIRNIRMKDIGGAAISFNMFYEQKGNQTEKAEVSEETPIFRNISIEETFCAGAKTAIHLKGLPEMPIHQLSFKHVVITADQGVDCTDAADIRFDHVTILPKSGPVWTFNDSARITLEDSGTTRKADTFAAVSGTNSKQIRFTRPRFTETQVLLRLAEEVGPDSVTGIGVEGDTSRAHNRTKI